ncbi:hypothetical protein SAY87_002796 [Trapa incisa]|uniref:Auxin-responsive protein n=1 Tax=Trapa incisa TaxID=236973 RepID=A0AAN7JX95_9MYRT|nr:hypothetical protein SAY87_002796 [Trapa incisa]
MDMLCHRNIDLEATELRLGLPGTSERPITTPRGNKRPLDDFMEGSSTEDGDHLECPSAAPPSKAQIVGWPPIRSYRKNSLQQKKLGNQAETTTRVYVKVSMDGAPYLRKMDLSIYKGYRQLLTALEDMFKFTIGEYSEREGYKGSEYAPTYEDKDGDWMLVGDVPWEMFACSCKRLRIMKGSEARGLTCCL